jgi:hypothetical protein
MTFCLRGRLETRIFLVLTVGLFTTLAVTATRHRAGDWTAYRSDLAVLALMGVLGLGWELVYHGLQQLRWDKDWPSFFVAAALLNEGLLLWRLAGLLPWVVRGSAPAFVVSVGAAWGAMWLFAQGPMRVLFLRWRLEGGRIRWGG